MTVYTRERSVPAQDELGEAEFWNGVKVVGSWDPAARSLPDDRDLTPNNSRPVIGRLCGFVARGSAVVTGFAQGPAQVARGSLIILVGADRTDPGSWAHYPRGGAEPIARYEE